MNSMESTNRKIINATPVVARDGTQMKSQLEKRIYEALLDLGLEPRYEQEVFTYWEGFKPTVPFYDMGSKRKLRSNNKKLVCMRYKPDFVFDYDGIKVIIEAKGWENDQFPIRKKLFRAYLETVPYPVVYAEIFTKKQLFEFIETLKSEAKTFKSLKMVHTVKEKVPDCIMIEVHNDTILDLIEYLPGWSERIDKDGETKEDKAAQVVESSPNFTLYSKITGDFMAEDGDIIVILDDVPLLYKTREDFERHFELIA